MVLFEQLSGDDRGALAVDHLTPIVLVSLSGVAAGHSYIPKHLQCSF